VVYGLLGDYHNAISFCTQACKLSEYKDHTYIADLADVYALSGNFGKADEYIASAIKLADPETKQDYENRLALYKSGKAWRKASEAKPKDANSSR
jgi:tetratricopeptide (TPR) repeat protein